MYRLLFLTCLFASSQALCSWESFMEFTQRHGKIYRTVEEMQKRFSVYEDNIRYVSEINANQKNYTLGETRFADMTLDEFKTMQGMEVKASTCGTYDQQVSSVPQSIDWREKNAVTPVKDQGQCGSCWSFSATGAMEGAWAIAKGELVSLSEQELVDCSAGFHYGNHGCNGGLMDGAFQFAIDNGMCTEQEYSYTAKQGSCEQCTKEITISSCQDVPSKNQMALKEAVSIGPVSVAIEADTRTFQLYKSGVITSDACGTKLDHGVLTAGYGEEDGIMYWLVKNSWGSSWGEQGYVKIERSDKTNDPGVCGISMQPSFPIV